MIWRKYLEALQDLMYFQMALKLVFRNRALAEQFKVTLRLQDNCHTFTSNSFGYLIITDCTLGSQNIKKKNLIKSYKLFDYFNLISRFQGRDNNGYEPLHTSKTIGNFPIADAL
jgi:hypothetical protein